MYVADERKFSFIGGISEGNEEQEQPLDDEAELWLDAVSNLDGGHGKTAHIFRNDFRGDFERLGPILWYALNELERKQRASVLRWGCDPVENEVGFVKGIVLHIAAGYGMEPEAIEADYDDWEASLYEADDEEAA